MNNHNSLPAPLAKKRRRPKKQFKNFLLAASALILVVFLSSHFLISIVSKPQILSSGTASQTATLEGVLIKDEKVFKSPSNGRLHLVEPDGKRLEMGGKAAEIISAEQDVGAVTFDIFTDTTGILCSHLDGYESILSPGNIGALEMPVIEKTDVKPVSDGVKVDKGQPVFKIIDNLSPVSIYGAVPKSAFAGGYPNQNATLQAAWQGAGFSLTPGKLKDAGDNLEGLFLLSEYPEQMLHQRKVSITVSTRVLNGLLVPEKAVVFRGDQPGLYLAVKKKALWTPVEIEGAVSGKAAVSGDGIIEGVRYVSNPALIREGWSVE